MAKHVAIVGSRSYPDLFRVQSYVATLPPEIIVVSGGAHGVDSVAEQAARKQGLETLIFPADWEKYGKSAGFKRNIQIVEASDIVVAFWDGVSKGTLHSISEAAKRNIKVVIYGVEKVDLMGVPL
jgi:hypothetical protein